jgi:predicted transcriptional regulator of viral defense system
MLGFRFQDVVRKFQEKHPAHLTKILADMVDKGMLCKISRNNYHIIPLNADPETYMPNSHQVAKYFMQNKDYYIGYASALKIHGLIRQSEDKESKGKESEIKEYVVTQKQVKPAIRDFRGMTIHFIQHDESRFFGFESVWINQLEKAMVSDLEKTLVDIATKPQLVGGTNETGSGIIELGYALYHAKELTEHHKLFNYFARNINKSAKKRFLFLTDLLSMEWTKDHDRMMDEIGPSISLLDPSAPDQGKKRSKFGLKINVDPDLIKQNVLDQYTRH